MKLYYMPGACSLTDHIALEWIGKPYEAEKLDHDEIKKDWYLKLNSNGAVPVFEQDDWVLTQNVAILNYLADSFPESNLGGDGSARSRAEINRWLAFLNADVHPAFRPLFGATDYLGDDTAAKTKKKARTRLRDLFGQANKQLQGREWLTGSRSIADPYLFVVLRWAKSMKVDLSGYDNLERFFERMSKDSAVQKVLKEEGLS
ncbi:MAG: glutathione binding-like protein [Rhodanobacteraceae bacterium]